MVVIKASADVGLFAAHSLRAGGATAAAIGKLSQHEISIVSATSSTCWLEWYDRRSLVRRLQLPAGTAGVGRGGRDSPRLSERRCFRRRLFPNDSKSEQEPDLCRHVGRPGSHKTLCSRFATDRILRLCGFFLLGFWRQASSIQQKPALTG